ncbi:restriction endonuclease [Polaribacter sp. M15]|jgi:restriction system protein
MIKSSEIEKGPKSLIYCYHIIYVLKEIGGSGTSSEVIDGIIEEFDFDESELLKVHKSGSSVFRSNVSLAKHFMTKTGYIDSSKRGIWTLTDLGYTTSFEEISEINEMVDKYNTYSKIQDKLNQTQNKTSFKKEEREIKKIDKLQIQLSEILSVINPFEFERLIQRLLREAGFEKVKVTKKTNDGGIDGFGFYPINHFISLKIMFQCKRFKSSISSPMIRDFRGAIVGRADKGLFITTSYFSKDAIIEANRDGFTHIELIDIDKLFEVFKETGLGFTDDKSKIDKEFFKMYE